VSCLLALTLLPASDIDLAFQYVSASVVAGRPSIRRLQKLLRCIEKQWLKKATIGAAWLSLRDNTARTNDAMESFHASTRRRVKVAQSNRFTFLGHLTRTTTDHQNDMARFNRGLTIRRAKKKMNLINDARIKNVHQSLYDDGAHTPAYSSCVLQATASGAHSALVHEANSDSNDSEDDMNVAAEEEVAAQPEGDGDQQQNDVCEMCL